MRKCRATINKTSESLGASAATAPASSRVTPEAMLMAVRPILSTRIPVTSDGSDSTEPSTRAKVQGTLDVLIALAGASGGALSGMVVAHSSYAVLSLMAVRPILSTRIPVTSDGRYIEPI